MYRPTDNAAPRTPQAKASSSGLLAAFKALTSTKSKVAPSSPSTTATTLPPIPADFSDVAQQAKKQGISTTAPPTKPPISNGTHLSSSSLTGKVPGGPDHLAGLLDQLSNKHNLSTRAKAAGEVAQLLKVYPIANVVDIWTTAKDLIQDDESPETHTAGYSLLYACVKHKTLTPRERAFFFEAIPRQENTNTFGLRFKVLRAITEDARYLDSLENMIIPLLVKLLWQCYHATARSRKKANRSINDVDEATNAHRGSSSQLKQVFSFIEDVIKFNSKLCTQDDLKTLVDELLDICRSTAEEDDIGHAVQIIDALITYSQLHPENLQAYIKVTAGAYVTCSKIREQVWNAISHLLHSHHGPSAHEVLLGILKEPGSADPKSASADVNSMRGAVQIYTRIVSSPATEEPLPQTSVSKLISSCRKSLAVNNARLEKDVLILMLEIIQHLDTTGLLLEDKRWNNFAEIITHCSKRLPAKDRPSLKPARSHSPAGARPNLIPRDAEAVDQGDRLVSFHTLQGIADYLMTDTLDMDFDHRSRAMSLFLGIVGQLDDGTATTLIEFYALEILLLPSMQEWQRGCDQLLNSILCDSYRSLTVRKLVLRTLHDAYNSGEAFEKADVDNLMLAILARLTEETDATMVEEISNFASGVAAWTSNEAAFTQIIATLEDALLRSRSRAVDLIATPDQFDKTSASDKTSFVPGTSNTHIAQALVTTFLSTVKRSPQKTQTVFQAILRIASSSQHPEDARLVCLQLLFHLRADTNHAIFVLDSTDCEDLAETLCRTERTANSSSNENPHFRPVSLDGSSVRRPTQSTVSTTNSASSASLHRANIANSKSSGSLKRASKAPRPLWTYCPRLDFAKDSEQSASRLVYAFLRPGQVVDLPLSKAKIALNLASWLEFLLSVLQEPDASWEIYSYVLVHLGAQLTNHALFIDCIPQIRMLRGIVCQQLSNKNFHEPPPLSSLKKDDVALCLYNVLTMLLGYHDRYSKNEEDDMVKMFVLGIGSWEKTADTCIHALSVCCHETPLSITKSVGEILQRMSQIITRGQAAVHILEFLTSLARLPALYRNFREDEFKMVFGICFNYLRFVRDRRRYVTESRLSNTHLKGLRTGRDSPVAPDSERFRPSLADELPQYVYTLTYHVMTFWFISLRLQDRAKHVPWIQRNLAYQDPDSDDQDVLEEQAQVLIDLMERISYTDRDETEKDVNFATEYDGPVSKKSWLVGMSILTIETAGRTGASQITHRRPSCTKFSYVRPNFVNQPRYQVPATAGSAADSYENPEYVAVLPQGLLQDFYSPQNIGSTLCITEPPIPLDDSDMTNRSISSFDRISPLDGHKAGIIYVGEDQTTESDILQNVMGSADYTAFLNKIGTLTELKGARFNTQGLDRDMDLDGKFTFVWRDRVSELVFHVTTMMPTNVETDVNCTAKKRHIGNDFVNIVFNNSGQPFRFDTLPSDFNYVYIVITPEARASFIETRLGSASLGSTNSSTAGEAGHRKGNDGPWDHVFYKVTVLTRQGIPEISPAAQTKIISGASLPAFVRLLTLNASVFCHVWASKELSAEHISSWRSRLREIKKLRERHASNEASTAVPAHQSYSSPTLPAKSNSIGRTTSNNAISNLNLAINSNVHASGRESSGMFGSSMRDSVRSPGESAVFRRQSTAAVFTLDSGQVASPSSEPGLFNVQSNPNRYSTLSRGSATTDMERSSSQGSAR